MPIPAYRCTFFFLWLHPTRLLITLMFVSCAATLVSIRTPHKAEAKPTCIMLFSISMTAGPPTSSWGTAAAGYRGSCHDAQLLQTVLFFFCKPVLPCGCVQALWALAAVQKSLVLGRKQAASAIMNTLKKHCTKPYNRKLYEQFPSLCDQLIRLCNHQPPAKAKSVSPPLCSPLLLLCLIGWERGRG